MRGVRNVSLETCRDFLRSYLRPQLQKALATLASKRQPLARPDEDDDEMKIQSAKKAERPVTHWLRSA